MTRIEQQCWQEMLDHAQTAYPRECCGILLGTVDGNARIVTVTVPCRNAYEGDQSDRFLIDPADQLAAQKRARAEDLDVVGFFHSHPDCDAYFSATDLANSWPWYSNVVLSVVKGRFARAACFIVDEALANANPEELIYPQGTKHPMAKILIPTPLRQYAGGSKEVEVAGATVADALAALTSSHADLKKHLYNEEGRLRSFVNIYVNDEDIRYLEKESTKLGEADTISIIPSIAGGAR